MTPKKSTLEFRTVGASMIVLRENKNTPRDDDWDAFLHVLASNRENFPRHKILVFTDGGGPNREQRKRLEAALGGKLVRVAVVSESVKVRFIVSSIALLNRDICTFSPREISEAYRHLDMNSIEQRQADAAVREMNATVDL
jgi:hypothetical protein